MSGVYRPCIVCGEVSEGSTCPEHTKTATERRRTSPRARGYDAAWDRLSARARAAQPFCSVCGATERLTCDHLPSAWERKAKGLPIRLEDVDVLCAEHNTDAGSSRPDSDRARAADPRGVTHVQRGSDRRGEDFFPTLSAPEGENTPQEVPEGCSEGLRAAEAYPVDDHRLGRLPLVRRGHRLSDVARPDGVAGRVLDVDPRATGVRDPVVVTGLHGKQALGGEAIFEYLVAVHPDHAAVGTLNELDSSLSHAADRTAQTYSGGGER